MPLPCNSRPHRRLGTPLGWSARRWLVGLQPWVGIEGLVSPATDALSGSHALPNRATVAHFHKLARERGFMKYSLARKELA
ncbi:hypothetical protein TNIN_205061 [Trichonephila inaurata madagascariensis]|uniref:Uncharacterized protein n=1 Tax=Trichonephila inaurata madagascariensis TaxID=2747483 RepID=A0A8X6YMP9_9ARAC|nr:hypothetical protein TNIN_205061 [Trichonephila inaurata madagascariensis]